MQLQQHLCSGGARGRCLRGRCAPGPALRRVCRAAAAAQAAAPLQQLNALLDWAAANKVATDKLAIARDLATDAPLLVAAKDVGAGEALLTVPEAAWVSPQAACQHPRIGKLIAGLEPWLQLALLLLAERGNPGSSLAPYIASLPSAPDSPLFWSDEELRLLAGTQLLELVQGYKQFFREQHAQLESELFAAHRDAFPAAQYDHASFAWAVASVRSRLHAPLDAQPLALVPLADALPHKRAANVTWRLKPAGLFGAGQALVVEAARPLRKGEGLALDYGPDKLDNVLLLDHGAIDTAALKGGYSLTLTLPESDTYYGDKADILERAGLGTSASFNLARGQEPPLEMLGFLRLMQLTGADCFLLEAIFEAEVWDFMCAPVSGANEAAVCGCMVDGAREALAGYATSIEEDLASLREGGLVAGSRQEAAVQVRLGEKEALDGLLAFFEGRGADLAALEYYQERRLKRLGLMDEDGSTTYDSFFRDGIA